MKSSRPGLWLNLFDTVAVPSMGLRERLCSALRQAVRNGNVSRGERLPATRVMAEDLGISRVTVEAAYAQLAAEGYLVRRVGHGSFVAIEMTTSERLTARRSKLGGGLAHGTVALSMRGQTIVGTGGCHDPFEVHAFAAGSPELRAFPHALWRQLLSQRLRRQAPELMRYGDPQGRAELRHAIAQYLIQSRGVVCSADQVLVLSSSQQALQLLSTVLLDPDDPVWIEDPGYRGARAAFAAAGAQLVPVPVDEQGMVFDTGQPAPRLVYVTPSHQYPTGHTLSLARRLALIEYVQRNGSWIIEDDYDSEFLYDGRPTPSLQGLDGGQRVIYVGTFSKSLFPSLRIAYAVLPPQLVAPLVTARSLYDGHAAQLAQAVTADFIAHGHFAAHLRLMRQLYRSRRDLLLDMLATHVPWVWPLNSTGGLQIGVALPHGLEADLSRRAAAKGIVTPSLGALYQQRDQARDGWLLGFAALQPDEIAKAVKVLGSIGTP